MPTKTEGGKQKPQKPYTEFPLYAHRNGQWAKKIKGKTWFFGTWGATDDALTCYLDQVDDIQAGRDPNRQRGVATPDTVTVCDLVNLYLESLDERCQRGDVTPRHFSDCIRTSELIVGHFGRKMAAAKLRAADFGDFRKAFPTAWGPGTVGNEIQRIRGVFRWAAASEIIPGVPNFGPDFSKPAKRVLRIAKANREAKSGKLDFSAAELKKLVDNSDGWLKAAILLGINSGFGNADCARLQENHIDFGTGWYDLLRQKTGIPRRCFMWQETRDAIREAMKQRPVASDDENDTLCFLTSHGRPVYWESINGKGTASRVDNVGNRFRKLVESAKIRKGRGFYSLRRTFETVAGNTQDQIAVNFVMGHCDESMAAVYRQGIDDQRLIDVAEHVRLWLFGK